MAGLSLGVPVVTTVGALSEPFWPSSGAVRVAQVGDAVELAGHVQELLGDPRERGLLSQRGQELYERMFGLNHIVSTLRAA
jgi:glycosyltransferase involved in cell wall biosynthesis